MDEQGAPGQTQKGSLQRWKHACEECRGFVQADKDQVRKVRIRLRKQLDLTRYIEGAKKSFYRYTGDKRKKTWALSRRSRGYTGYEGG